MIANFASEISEIGTPALSQAVTLIRPDDVAGPGVLQVHVRTEPDKLVHAGIETKVDPLFTEIATSNRVAPEASHEMLKGVPVASLSPPLGAVTLTDVDCAAAPGVAAAAEPVTPVKSRPTVTAPARRIQRPPAKVRQVK